MAHVVTHERTLYMNLCVHSMGVQAIALCVVCFLGGGREVSNLRDVASLQDMITICVTLYKQSLINWQELGAAGGTTLCKF